MSDLRPISLCSVLYKIISRIMVKRLQPILPMIVSPNQSAFVPEMFIQDNIIIAHEIVHSLRTDQFLSKEFMAVKFDMSKAYDRVEWKYVEALLQALGFHSKWIVWVMRCISSVTYSVLINDQPVGLIFPQRGLRQGDPLSPSLFVLCTEGLSHLLNRAEQAGLFNGIKFSDQGPSIHHLLFADDSLFICKANVFQCHTLKLILKIYGAASRQTINLSKSSITFGSKVENELGLSIRDILGIQNEGGAGSYLGLPECFSGSKVVMLNYIQDRLKSRLAGWFSRTLSHGGKEVLIKAVAMAMPIYAMSCFKFPKTTITKLASAISDFWWNSLEHKKKIHWISWEKLCLAKNQGGLGFRDLECFNQALLAKQAWRIYQNPDSLFSKVLKSKYFDQNEFHIAVLGVRPSFAWTSILYGRSLLLKGLVKRVGNGASISVWVDPWLDMGGLRPPLIKNLFINIDLKVSELIDPITKSWIPEKINDLFYPVEAAVILKNKPVVSKEDFWVWKFNKSGDYSVKSGYWLSFKEAKQALILEAEMLPSLNGLKEQVWYIPTAPKIKAFLWKCLCNAIPVSERLCSRGLNIDLRCQACGVEGESVNHVLFSCSLARQVWALSNYPQTVEGFHQSSAFVNFQYLLQGMKRIEIPMVIRRSFPWILWFLWKNRNKFLFEGIMYLANETIDKIHEEESKWFLAKSLEGQCDSNLVVPQVNSPNCWKTPPQLWVKCNIGCSCDRNRYVVGGAWVLRDSLGNVILHSRRSFPGTESVEEARIICLKWSMESIHSHRFKRVIFEFEDSVLVSATTRPIAWPSFGFQSNAILDSLRHFLEWKVLNVSRQANRGAFLIAQSVTRDLRTQSYVALGAPIWLKDLFVSEKVCPLF